VFSDQCLLFFSSFGDEEGCDCDWDCDDCDDSDDCADCADTDFIF